MTSAPFTDLDHYVAYPRLGGLAISPDGARLVTTVATMTPKGTGYATALWQIDPEGQALAQRLTRSAKGEAGAAFSVTGDLYFTSARPDPDASDDDGDAALWQIGRASCRERGGEGWGGGRSTGRSVG